MRKSRSSSAKIDFPSHQFRRISNPQRNRSNLFCLRISNPQERLRRIEAPACFGGFQIRRNAYGGLKPPLVSVDLQSAASYLFRICNPLQVTAQERKKRFLIRKRKKKPVSADLQSAAVQETISDLQSASSNGARTKKYP